MKYTFAIGDVHGMNIQLVKLVNLCLRKHPNPKFVFVGDYIDRGPDSRGVVEFLIRLSQTYECVFLRGNHEDMLMNDFSNFLGNGGRETLKSYGAGEITCWPDAEEARKLIPEEHWVFFRATELYHQDVLRTFVHAGIYRHHGDMKNQSERVLLWIRYEFLDDHSEDGGYVVHGHTPMENGNLPMEKYNRVNIDTGAVFGGKLTAALFNDVDVRPIEFIQVDSLKGTPNEGG